MSELEAARSHMIESQLRPNKVTDERVLAAFACIRRELFVPEPLQTVAYIDEDLPLGGGRYLMEPMVAGRLIQAAAVARTETVLVVGAATGYEAAVLSVLARRVVALEEDAELARRARAALVDHAIASVEAIEAPLRHGHRPRAPYDAILFAGAVAAMPTEIVEQLAEGGRLVAVERSAAGIGHATLTKRTGGVLARRVMFDAATPLLPGLSPAPVFTF
jgi:protein-L-isoaspartate(D-aspartate) O-methyltransferase